MSRDWKIYLLDMAERCERILGYTNDLSREEFDRHDLVYDATLRNIELLGEAARHVPDDVRKLAEAIDWRGIIAVRNILIHGYLGIDDDVLWDIVQRRVPELKKLLEGLNKTIESVPE